MHLKLIENQEQYKLKISRCEEIISIRAEINEIGTKQLYKESMKEKVGTLKR
jgi:hypothetical protein